ncbi:MAG TPA: YeeE/YedE family protein [Nitrospirae bacterium]|nr:YeeE/YedE family protein [Nitrospirota bacterium]
MSEKAREGFIIALIIAGFLWVIYLIMKIKGFGDLNVDNLSDEEIAAIKSSIRSTVIIGGFIIGGLMGAVVQRSKFCIAAACHSIVTTRDLTQTRAYAMALFVAILGTQILYKLGYVDINYSIYVSSPFTWLSYIVGGFIFGVGIVYAGGCASRILVRAGEGNLGGLVSVMAFIFTSGATLWGILAKVRVDYFNKLTLNFQTQYIPDIINAVPFWVILVVIEAVLLIFMLRAPKDSEWWGWRWPLAGVAIGLTIVFAWWLNGLAFKTLPVIDSFSFTGPDDPTLLQRWRPKSLTFALADAQAFRYIILWTGESINFAIATVFGVIFGSFIAAVISRTFNWVAPPLEQFKYNLLGGLLMGFGAVLALGCNIGQGLSGFSTLSAGSILTMSFILIGAISGAKFLQWRLMRSL